MKNFDNKTKITYILIGAVLTLLLSALLCACAERIDRPSIWETQPDGSHTDISGEQIGGETSGGGVISLDTSGNGGSSHIGGDDFDDDAELLNIDIPSTGESDCILIRADGKVIMIDTGEENNYQKIKGMLDGYGITKIDLMIITHYDNDHVGCAGRLIREYEVTEVYGPDYVRVSDYYSSMMTALGALGVNTKFEKLTDVKTYQTENLKMTVAPTHLYDSLGAVTIRSDNESEDAEENNFSLITHLTYGEQKFLFTGDAEKERLAEYMADCDSGENGLEFDCKFIKLPHHGEYSTQLGKLISRAGPSYGVVCARSSISVQDGLESAMKLSILYYTYKGDVRITSDGKNIKVSQ